MGGSETEVEDGEWRQWETHSGVGGSRGQSQGVGKGEFLLSGIDPNICSSVLNSFNHLSLF